MFKYSMAFLLAFTALSTWAGNTVDASNSATAQKYMAGCGFDYKCDSSGNRINNVPTAPQVTNNDPKTVNLGGGSHSVQIISEKPKQQSLDSKVLAMKTAEQPASKLVANNKPTEPVEPKKVETKAKPTEPAQPQKVESNTQPAKATQQSKPTPAENKTEPTKSGLPPMPKSKPVLNNTKPIADRTMGASEIIETHKSEHPYGVEKSAPLSEKADADARKPLTEDDWKGPEEPTQQVAEEKMQNQQQKTDKTKTTQQKTQKPEQSEQKTKIKKMDLNKEKWWESGANKKMEPKPSKSTQTNRPKLKPTIGQDPFETSEVMKLEPTDPFATSKVLDGKHKGKTSISGRRSGAVSYGGDTEIELQKQANANKQARIAREQAQKDADAAFMAGMLTDTMMNAAIGHIDAKNAKKKGGGGGTQTVTYETYDDYSPDDEYTYTQKESKLLNQAKKMTNGGGW